jgi:hypothetical protein
LRLSRALDARCRRDAALWEFHRPQRELGNGVFSAMAKDIQQPVDTVLMVLGK